MEGKKSRAILMVTVVMAMLVDQSSANVFRSVKCYFTCAIQFHDFNQLMACVASCTNPPSVLPPAVPGNSCANGCSVSCYQKLGPKAVPGTTMEKCMKSCSDSCSD
ncbi:hypothetical protein Dimus_004346 [Dionaea muscipula]